MRIRFFLALFLFTQAAWATTPTPPVPAARAWLLADYASRQVLTAKDADKKIEPASLTKMMTAYVTFNALRDGRIKLTDQVKVSERAWKEPGSRMFIEPGKPVSVEELLHGLVIQSGNDAAVALAEAVGGSEDAFVGLMNKEAVRLHMANTHFTNATGLPDPALYSTALDLSLLARAIIHDYPQYYPWFSIKEYRFNGINQPNRNRLLWLDPNVDGLKTGHTETAGFCLVASAKRGEMRLISVVIGAGADSARVTETQKLLNFGFRNFETHTVYTTEATVTTLPVWKGSGREVKAGVPENFSVTVPKGDYDRLQASISSDRPLLAPIQAGQPVGMLKVELDGHPLNQSELVAKDTVSGANIFRRAWDSLRLMLQN